MSFPVNLTSVLTGLTESQLRNLRKKEIVVPEVRKERPPLYSFRDLVALRSIARLRAEHSAQGIAKAFKNLDLEDLTEHPSMYKFGAVDGTIVIDRDGQAMDLLRRPGNMMAYTFEEVTRAFSGWRGKEVVDFNKPHRNVEVSYGRLGGWPTIADTRVPFDTISDLVDMKTVFPEDVQDFYPTVSEQAAADAVDFSQIVEGGSHGAA